MDKTLKILQYDGYLKPYEKDLIRRKNNFDKTLSEIGDLDKFSRAYEYYGIHKVGGGYIYREFAPKADRLFLLGDFNGWNRENRGLRRINDSDFEIFIGENENFENSRVKVRVVSGKTDEEKIPLYAFATCREKDFSLSGLNYNFAYQFKYGNISNNEPLIIYEAHVGMSSEEEKISTYKEFREKVLPRICAQGFTAVQFMGIMEHPYYASFGYQVGSFFAPSSFYGAPDELKRLIDECHKNNVAALLDIVHSHAAKNVNDGINAFDGSDFLFSGDHPSWGTKVFDYGKKETLRFLLSNVRYYMEEYRFDGLRFDGVTSMLYKDFGMNAFTDYSQYFSNNTNESAVTYLQLANCVARLNNKSAVTIAEDMSGMPGTCLKIEDGGIGFDYRLAMGEPDMWIKLIKEKKDEDWSVGQIYHTLTDCRYREKRIAYAESHDQALVGDKTLIFRLADKEMYSHMLKTDPSAEVARAVSYYKLIYGITMSLGGEGYLNFMGNEFGHPEWIDFPRDGNGNSYKYARRQWSLADADNLKYSYLNAFNKKMIELLKSESVLSESQKEIYVSEKEQIIAYKKGVLLFAFNFNPKTSFTDKFLQLNEKKSAKVVLSSDDLEFGGQGRVQRLTHFSVKSNGADGIMAYLPARTFTVFKLD